MVIPCGTELIAMSQRAGRQRGSRFLLSSSNSLWWAEEEEPSMALAGWLWALITRTRGKWDEWQWLIQWHIVSGGDSATQTGHLHKEEEESEGELSCRWPEYQLGRMFFRRLFLIFQLLDLKTWTLPWPREANELQKSALSWLTWDTLRYFVN